MHPQQIPMLHAHHMGRIKSIVILIQSSPDSNAVKSSNGKVPKNNRVSLTLIKMIHQAFSLA
jgi:hypothetical protein